jgi:hypothetical protein
VGSPILAFPVANAKLSRGANAQTSHIFGYPGATPSISANGANNGIVWAVNAVLYAYNATDLTEIYDSTQASGGRDELGPSNKFITPIIVNGKVFVGTTTGVAVYGLLPQ